MERRREKMAEIAKVVSEKLGWDVINVYEMKSMKGWLAKFDPGPNFPAYIHIGFKYDKLDAGDARVMATEALEDAKQAANAAYEMREHNV